MEFEEDYYTKHVHHLRANPHHYGIPIIMPHSHTP